MITFFKTGKLEFLINDEVVEEIAYNKILTVITRHLKRNKNAE